MEPVFEEIGSLVKYIKENELSSSDVHIRTYEKDVVQFEIDDYSKMIEDKPESVVTVDGCTKQYLLITNSESVVEELFDTID